MTPCLAMGTNSSAAPNLGANPLGKGGFSFLVWAPFAKSVTLQILGSPAREIPMEPEANGYYRAELPDIAEPCLYYYRVGPAKCRPDPASHFQPQGINGPSQAYAHSFVWQDQGWRGMPLDDLVFYEIHTGAFTPEGTFDAIIPRLASLRSLGITAIELMPVAQFSGERNWGYDGVFPFAVQNSYGGPSALKRLVDACHSEGLCVALDVVYNHLGPEGNVFADFGPYLTDHCHTPWGQAINFDQEGSDEVRRFFIENALYWVRDFHIDVLRLDAVHAIVDSSPQRFLAQLQSAVAAQTEASGRQIHLIAENDRNDARVVRSPDLGGDGLAAQWNDDFHHSVHAMLTGETSGYYQDFGDVARIAKAFSEGYVYTGEYSRFRRRSQGSPSQDIPARRFVVFAQNHDQIGNRKNGERLRDLVDFERLKVAAGLVLLSPFLPLLFMGEEYADASPFLYFVSHADPHLIENVRKGRRREFGILNGDDEVPDPQAADTFARSKLNWSLRTQEPNRQLLDLYGELLRLRDTLPALKHLDKRCLRTTPFEQEKVLLLHRWHEDDEILAIFHLAGEQARVALPVPPRTWRKLLDSEEEMWAGSGACFPAQLSPADPLEIAPKAGFALYHAAGESRS